MVPVKREHMDLGVDVCCQLVICHMSAGTGLSFNTTDC